MILIVLFKKNKKEEIVKRKWQQKILKTEILMLHKKIFRVILKGDIEGMKVNENRSSKINFKSKQAKGCIK